MSAYNRIYGNSNPDLRDRNFQDPFYSRDPYRENPNNFPFPTASRERPQYDFNKSDVGNFTPFYIAITICTIIGFALFLLNIFLGCCSRYSDYWNDRHTGNRWIVSLWTTTPHKQPPIDLYTELKEISSKNQVVYHHPQEEIHSEATEYLELAATKESEI